MQNIREELLTWLRLLALLVIWAAVLFLSGTRFSISWEALSKLPHVVTIYILVSLIFTRWLWRWHRLQGWLVPYPDLEGTWAGTIQSTWSDPQTGQQPRQIPVLLVVKQTFFSLSCIMYSKESTSHSNAAQLVKDDDSDSIRLTYNFTNRPLASIRERSEIHDGAAILTLVPNSRPVLKGEYWTNRKTTGDIHVLFKSKKREGGFSTDTAGPIREGV